MSCPLFLTWLPRMAMVVRPLGATGWRMAAGAVCLGALLAQVQTQAQTVRPGLWEFEGRHSQLRQSSGQTVDMQKINQQLETQLLGMEPGVRRMLEDNLRSVGVVVDRGATSCCACRPTRSSWHGWSSASSRRAAPSPCRSAVPISCADS
jgi:hypothetical protein